MRIGISLLCAKHESTGIENVAYNILRCLPEVDDRNEYVVFVNRDSVDWFELPSGRFEIVKVNRSFRRCIWVWEHLFFYFDPRRTGVDLVHFPLARGVLGYRGKCVLTVHDLNAYLGLHGVQRRQQILYRLWYDRNAARANLIVTVSETVRDHILQHLPVAPERVRVVYNGVDERFRPRQPSSAFRAKLNLPGKYILFLGSTYGNKNLVRLLDAYQEIRRDNSLPHHLVIAGGRGDAHERVVSAARQKGLREFVHLPGYLPAGQLPELYGNADLFVFPSLAEGFGIPALEAMACGTPVVASDIPVMREVLGDAALGVDPCDTSSIAGGMRRLLTSPELRAKLVEKGRQRARLFTWRRAAREMARLYEEAAGMPA